MGSQTEPVFLSSRRMVWLGTSSHDTSRTPRRSPGRWWGPRRSPGRWARRREGSLEGRRRPHIEANDTVRGHLADGDAEAQVDHVLFGIPGEPFTAGRCRIGQRQLRRRAIGGAGGPAEVDAVEIAVALTAEEVALVRAVNNLGPADARRGWRCRDFLSPRSTTARRSG